MSELSHRERVMLAFDHQEPDRVPMDLMGNASMIIDETYFKLKEHLGFEEDIEPIRKGSTANYYDVRVLEYFDIDFRRLFLPTTSGDKYTYLDDGTFIGPWGIQWSKTGIYVNYIGHPLDGADLDEVANYEWPDPHELWHTEGLAEEAKHLYETTDYALVARNPLTWGFLDRGSTLRGMENYMLDLSINPEIAHLIIQGTLDVYKEVYDMFLQAVGPYVHMVEYGDDLGSQDSSLISPDMYREFIKPAQKELFDLIRDRAPNAKIFMHSDGALRNIIPDLIDVGVDVLNPVQPSASGMESEGLKEDFGDQLIFHGAVDQKPQEGTEGEIREEVRRRIDALAPGGGYVLAPCNVIVDPPIKNILAMFDEAQNYGKYPIGNGS